MCRLRFPIREIRKWAGKYDYKGDDELLKIYQAVLKRQSYTREEFIAVSRWKSQLVRRRASSNDEALVQQVTNIALTAQHERIRIGVLIMLNGVGWPTASTLLHFGHREPYPILDFRALWSLGNQVPSVYTFEFWWDYVTCCRKLCKESGESMRTVDRALWAYSKHNQRIR